MIFILLIGILGVLPTNINITKISAIRTDIHPYRNALANSFIELVEKSPYLLPSQPIPSDDPKIVKLSKQLTKGKNSDLEKSEAFFAWVSQNVTYDVEKYYQEDYWLNHPDAAQVLNSRIAMCMGYSRLNAALHRAAGIEAKVVYGENHAWNEIKINGEWQTQDPTYAAGFLDEKSKIFIKSYTPTYFSKSDFQKEGEYSW